jgi:uncharacterized protein YndB with AHSA1/START domain
MTGKWDSAQVRVDSASTIIEAPRPEVYAALIDRRAVAKWLPPSGATGIIHEFEPLPGGAFSMTLVFDAAGTGKSSDKSDILEGTFIELIPNRSVRQSFRFLSADPRFAGIMIVTWKLFSTSHGTRVTVSADDVPPGILQHEHEAGMASSLAKLSAYLIGE